MSKKSLNVILKKDNIEKVLLLDNGITQNIIFLFKNGTSSYGPMTTEILQGIYKLGCPIIDVKDLAICLKS